MKKNNYIHYQTFYDIEQYQKMMILLKQENIDFQIVNKSNQTNYRVPMSTYIEIDLLVSENDFQKVDNLLTDINI